MITREIQLAAQITGIPTPGHFTVAETEVAGEVLVRTDQVGLAATYLELMRADCTIPVPAWQPGQRVGVATVGTVVRSDSPELAVGDLVRSMTGWSEYSAGPASGYAKLDRGLFPDAGHHLGQGPTAYYGMADVAAVGEGDVVFVSGAAGGIGSLAGQIARCLGAARVIGSAGSPAKADYLVNELGYDAAFDYHDGSVADRLRELAPDGVSVFFDVVGGAQYEAALQVARPGARFALCGSLSSQLGDAAERFPKPDRAAAEARNVELLPFSCYHTPDQIAAWQEHFGTWLAEGRFVYPQTVVEGGIEDVPAAFLALLQGSYRGNVSVRLS
ncbi:NADP-dependent oxidoreductase [Streptomyces sp. NBC_00053]|uniref:MDR family NADP-dependent oxidoreductase n=1 Tax=unclassified Streptomyces TaxID=2593676 RepID=UPI002252B0F5|nr:MULTISPECIES: NADP-dependent oxidoreductase [unclassified Streptomyces]MCX5501349.1 NADP-dependent oxidoreductase [Streptomyces sp. NBC_00052]MCX5550116.1 NADP-dependent oxidoreductase [Streptomyces sp. NBC_00051]WSP48242.1 NADP-dependent oxidoreductase [Streptomyces sp. NBC_01243]